MIWKRKYQDVVKVLRSIEWSGKRLIDGTSMGDGIEGSWPACPSCGNVEPKQYVENEFMPEAVGHLETCPLAAALREAADG